MTERSTQLKLIETQPEWRLDQSTREIGRKGVREAREAMRAALAARRGGGDRPDGHRSAA